VIVVTRFDVPEDGAQAFLPQAQAALSAFAARPGFVRGRVGRAPDDPTAWVLTTEWDSVGAYRRSLAAAPLLGQGRDEPSAFEVLVREDTAVPTVRRPSDRAADAATSGVGESSGPAVSDL
jgi:hypothetical protein